MPRSTKNSACVVNTSVFQDNWIVSQKSSNSDVEMKVQSPQFIQPSTSQSQPFVQTMFMPYIWGPKMDWTVNNSLYHKFLNWKLKCENILDYELAMLPDSKKCKKAIAWSGDFGMDQYVMVLAACRSYLGCHMGHVWRFLQATTNEVRARFDLLTSFRQGNDSEDEWYNAVQAQVSLAKYLPETASIFHRDIFWFFLKDEEFSKPLMTPTLIYTSFLQVGWGSLPRRWNLQSQLLDTSKQLQVTPKWHKLILWGIKE